MRAWHLAGAAALAVAVASCATGSDDSTTTMMPTTSPGGPSVTSTTLRETGTTSGASTTSTIVIAQELIIETSENGELQVSGPNVMTARVGDTVEIKVRSSVDGEVHVHGYDLFFDLAPGGEATLRFVADVPGIFEVELEGDHLLLFELEVSP